MPRPIILFAAAILGAGAPASFAQSPAAPPPVAQPAPQAATSLPPAIRLGLRADSLRRGVPIIPTVVIVPDPAAYVRAVAKWSISGPFTPAGGGSIGAGRFPVLIDDGTRQAREDIARFVRAFQPERVVRWSAPGATLPADAPGKQKAIEEAAAAPWNEHDTAGLLDHWRRLSFVPPGVVAASVDDPAWTAALALAAGRGQPIVWVKCRNDLNGALSLDEADALSRQIEAACAATGFSWDALGDDLDAITLCIRAPISILLGPPDKRGSLATTDMIGRRIPAPGAERTDRWAWTGQIIGNEPRAAYAAMCALFLGPSRAWLFDGYENKEPWSKWDCSAAAIELEKGGLRTLLNDNGRQSAADWRSRCAGLRPPAGADTAGPAGAGIDAGFIAVNTSGTADFFDLLPGQAKPGDVPFLRVPAIVHFVHSWSAIRPGDRSTVAGRWLERGAYAYVGSVHEPFLSGFVPTPNMAARLLARAPWGAATRMDNGPPWKITVIGDPLITLGPPAPRTKAPLPLEGAIDLQDSLAPALKEKRFAEALWTLAMLGRDSDASRLVSALLNDDAAAVTPEVALAGVSSVFLAAPIGAGQDQMAVGAARFATIARLCKVIGGKCADSPDVPDMLWHAAWPFLNSPTPDEVAALRANLRPDQTVRDAIEAAGTIERALGKDEADLFLAHVRGSLPDEAGKKLLDGGTRRR